MTHVDPGGSAVVEPPPPEIDELIGVIRNITKLMKDQARDLSRSKRLRRLILSLDGPGIGPTNETAGRPALLHWLSKVDEIIEPLETTFIDQLVAAYSSDPQRFEVLGLTANSPAWRLKHAGFSVAEAYARQPPSRFKTAEGKVLQEIEQREPVFALGDSIIGTGLAAVPVNLLSEGYQEVKENLEKLGGVAKKGASAVATGTKSVGRVVRKVVTKPLKIFKRNEQVLHRQNLPEEYPEGQSA
jgi:hypothetical protein